jgi:CRP/FNR family transcriptional regulator, cyclic AMP receptor protein
MTSLGSIPALRTVSQRVLDAIAVDARPVRYPADTVIRPPGRRATGVVLLLSGTVVASYPTPAGAQLWTDCCTGPRIVDKAAVLDAETPSYGLLALTAVTGRLLPAAAFKDLLDDHAGVRAHVLTQLARDLTATRDRLVDAVALPATVRVAAWLHAREPTDGPAWRGPQEHLARFLGLSRVTVNRAIARLTRHGAIESTPYGIVVIDRRRLADFAHRS